MVLKIIIMGAIHNIFGRSWQWLQIHPEVTLQPLGCGAPLSLHR
jgi:hypothetical protein